MLTSGENWERFFSSVKTLFLVKPTFISFISIGMSHNFIPIEQRNLSFICKLQTVIQFQFQVWNVQASSSLSFFCFGSSRAFICHRSSKTPGENCGLSIVYDGVIISRKKNQFDIHHLSSAVWSSFVGINEQWSMKIISVHHRITLHLILTLWTYARSEKKAQLSHQNWCEKWREKAVYFGIQKASATFTRLERISWTID